MPGTRITADERGRLKVPVDPIVPFVEGDGAGPVVWKAVRPLLDRAVQLAYEGARRIEWLEVVAGERAQRELNDSVPDSTVNAFRLHRVGLRAPIGVVPGSPRDLAGELAEILDLCIALHPVRLPAGLATRWAPAAGLDLVLVSELREDAAAAIDVRAGTPPMYDLVGWFNRELPAALARLPFGTPAAFDAYRASKGLMATGIVELALNVRHASRLSTDRAAAAALAIAQARGRKRVTFVRELSARNVVDDAYVDWSFQSAATNPAVSIRRSADRRPGPVPAVPDKRILVDDLPLGELLEELHATPSAFEVVVGPSGAIDVLARALVALVGGDAVASAMHLNPLTGHAVFEARQPVVPRADADQASPVGLLRAGEQLLEYLGWREAALLVRRVVDETLVAGLLPAPVAESLGLPPASHVTPGQFARAALERLG